MAGGEERIVPPQQAWPQGLAPCDSPTRRSDSRTGAARAAAPRSLHQPGRLLGTAHGFDPRACMLAPTPATRDSPSGTRVAGSASPPNRRSSGGGGGADGHSMRLGRPRGANRRAGPAPDTAGQDEQAAARQAADGQKSNRAPQMGPRTRFKER